VLLVPRDAVVNGAEAARQRLDGHLGVCNYSGTDAMLVRPDAHLGWRGDPDDMAGLDSWLANALRTGRVR
jgi:hypothetical protein